MVETQGSDHSMSGLPSVDMGLLLVAHHAGVRPMRRGVLA